MSDGFYELNNKSPQRGRKLRNRGSNPTGSQTLSFTPEYSAPEDYAVSATSLNHNVKRENLLNLDKPTRANRKLRGETGLIIKEPLS